MSWLQAGRAFEDQIDVANVGALDRALLHVEADDLVDVLHVDRERFVERQAAAIGGADDDRVAGRLFVVDRSSAGDDELVAGNGKPSAGVVDEREGGRIARIGIDGGERADDGARGAIFLDRIARSR